MVKNTFASFLLLFCMNSVYARLTGQSQLRFHFVEGIELNSDIHTIISYTQYKNVFYYASSDWYFDSTKTQDSDKLCQVIHTYDFTSKRQDSLLLYLPKSNTVTQWSLGGIAINERYISILRDSIYIFKAQSGKLINTIDRMNADGVKFIGPNQIFIYKNYDSHPKTDSIKSKLALYDIETKTLVTYLKPDFNYIGYTHLVHNFIDANSKNIAFSQTMPYNIKFYSAENLHFTSEVNSELKNDSNCIRRIDSVENIYNQDLNPKALFLELKKEDSIIRIEKITFLNDSTLLVSKTMPKAGFNKRLLDVWEYSQKQKKWKAIVRDQLYITEKGKTNYVITPDTIPFDFTFSNNIISHDSLICQVVSSGPPPMGMNSIDIAKYMDDYYTNHNLNNFLWVYTWEIK